MVSWNRRFLGVIAIGARLVGAACSSSEQSPVDPSSGASQGPLLSSTVTKLPGGVTSTSVDLLSCQSLPYAVASATIGREGGSLTVGKSTLVVPSGALKSPVTIKAEQVPGSANSIRFSPEGLAFAKPAKLSMGYDNCLLVEPTKRIVYTTEDLKVLDVLQSQDLRLGRTVTAPIDHFSRYAVAY
jgi:hypothetical protein